MQHREGFLVSGKLPQLRDLVACGAAFDDLHGDPLSSISYGAALKMYSPMIEDRLPVWVKGKKTAG